VNFLRITGRVFQSIGAILVATPFLGFALTYLVLASYGHECANSFEIGCSDPVGGPLGELSTLMIFGGFLIALPAGILCLAIGAYLFSEYKKRTSVSVK